MDKIILRDNERFFQLPASLLLSRAFNGLTKREKLVFFAVLSKFNGKNNGEIAVSYDDIAEFLGYRNDAVISNTIKKLRALEIIKLTKRGNKLKGIKNTYALTFYTSENYDFLANYTKFNDDDEYKKVKKIMAELPPVDESDPFLAALK